MNYKSWLLYFGGFVFFTFTRLSRILPTIPVTIVLSFILILRFSRTCKSKTSTLLIFSGFLVSINVALWGMFDTSSLFFNIIRSSLLALLYFIPFWLDKKLYKKFGNNKFRSTFIFPVITTAVFYLMTIEGPFEGAVQPAKFGFGSQIFLQIWSVLGVFGFVFLTTWIVSVSNYLWDLWKKEDTESKKKSRRALILAGIVIASVYIFGLAKITMTQDHFAETVRVAAIVFEEDVVPIASILENAVESPYQERLNAIEEKVIMASRNGSEIAITQEFAILINESKQNDLREELSRIAVENDIYLSINYGYYVDGGKGENKQVLIDNNGQYIIDYSKKYSLGIGDIGETAVFKKGPEVLQFADTPYGRISVSVCRDMDMAKYMIQAGQNNVDLMLSSSYEFPNAWEPNCTTRAFENGFSVVRAAYNGCSHSQDFNGKIIDTMLYDDPQGIMYTNLPTRGVKTLYPYIGHSIGRIALGTLLIMFAYLVFYKLYKRKK